MDAPIAKKLLRYVGSDFFIEIAKQRKPGHSGIHHVGRNPSVSTSIFDTIWTEGGGYVYPSNASTLTVSASSANDAGGGTGARTVEIKGPDAEFSAITETVSTNASTAVTTANSYSRVRSLKVITAGASAANSGNVYIGNGAVTAGKPVNVYAAIIPGNNISLQLVYTIPKGKSGLVLDLTASSSSSKEVLVEIRVRPPNQVFSVADTLQVFQAQVGHAPNIPEVLPSKTDIDVRAKITSGASDAVSGHLEILLIDNELIDNLID